MISVVRLSKLLAKHFRIAGWIFVFLSPLYFCNSAFSEMSDREFETQLVSQKRDFNELLKSRLKTSEQEVLAARAHGEKRSEEQQIQKELEASYRRQIKRYSMEEIEIQDRADEERPTLSLIHILFDLEDDNQNQYNAARLNRVCCCRQLYCR